MLSVTHDAIKVHHLALLVHATVSYENQQVDIIESFGAIMHNEPGHRTKRASDLNLSFKVS